MSTQTGPRRSSGNLAADGPAPPARRLLEGEIDVLVDALAADGVGWPAIAAVLGVSRQAARQAHHRRTGRVLPQLLVLRPDASTR